MFHMRYYPSSVGLRNPVELESWQELAQQNDGIAMACRVSLIENKNLLYHIRKGLPSVSSASSNTCQWCIRRSLNNNYGTHLILRMCQALL